MKISSAQVKAVLILLIGSILHSGKAIFIKLAYQYGADSVSLVALRMAFSLPFFLLVAWWSSKDFQFTKQAFGKKQWLHLVLLGLLGYYMASLFDFLSLQYLSAGVARLILFTYPTLVVLLSALFFRRAISLVEGLALLLSYSGVAIALYFGTGSFELNAGFGKGVLFSFGSALAYAVYLIGSGEYLPKMGTIAYTSITMTVAAIGILAHQLIQNGLLFFHFPAPVYYLCLGMAIFSTVIPSFMIAEGIKRIGASQSSIVSSVGPISTIILASIILGESFDGWQWLGALLVISSVVFISAGRKKTSQ